MSECDHPLRDATRDLYVAQSELESIQRSAGYKIACRARKLFEFFVPSTGKLAPVNYAVRRGLNIWLDEGAAMVWYRFAFKTARALRQWLGLAPENRQAQAAAERGAIVRFVEQSAPRPGLAAQAGRALSRSSSRRRSAAEMGHLLASHCQNCRHFAASSCSLMPGAAVGRTAFHEALSDPEASCPVGAWPVAAAAPPITRLNLVYHVTPIRHPEEVWQWNVRELLQRIDCFNGRRIVTVVTSTRGRVMDSPETVVRAFAGHSVEFRFAPNDPKLREASHFVPALREIASENVNEAVFYAHCKGVSHLDQTAVRPWTAAMYHHNLDRIDEVRELLRRWPCVGIAKRYGQFENLSLGRPRGKLGFKQRWRGWHFAGTFWWVRHDRLFSQPNWDKLPLHPYLVEAYLANFFEAHEAVSLAYDGIGDPYDRRIWEDERLRKAA